MLGKTGTRAAFCGFIRVRFYATSEVYTNYGIVSKMQGRSLSPALHFPFSFIELDLIDDLLRPLADVVHGPDPGQLASGLELLCDAFPFSHLPDEQLHHLIGLPVHFILVSVEFASELQPGVNGASVLFQIVGPSWSCLPAQSVRTRSPLVLAHSQMPIWGPSGTVTLGSKWPFSS